MTSPISACYADFGLTSTSELFYCAELINQLVLVLVLVMVLAGLLRMWKG
jgi:hypothetical protein